MLCTQVVKTMNMLPLTAKEAAAAGLITGAKHRLDALHSIQHFIPLDSTGQDEAVDSTGQNGAGGCGTGPKLPGTQSAESPGADMVTMKSASDEAGQLGQLETAAGPSTGADTAVADLVPFKLQNAAEKAALLQQYKASLPNQEQLADMKRHQKGLIDDHCGFHLCGADICTITPSNTQDAAEQTVHSREGCFIIPISLYADIIEGEVDKATEESAKAAAEDAKAEAKPTVAILHINGKCRLTSTSVPSSKLHAWSLAASDSAIVHGV